MAKIYIGRISAMIASSSLSMLLSIPNVYAQAGLVGAGLNYRDNIEFAQYIREEVRRGYRTDGSADVQNNPQRGLTFDQIQTLQQSLRDQQLSSVPRDIRDRRSVIGQ